MVSAMSGSRGRAFKHPRWTSLILGRLPLLVLLAFVLVNMNHPVKAENEADPPGEEDEDYEVSFVISSCDDLPHKRTEVFGIVYIEGDIICSENRFVRVSQTENREVVFVSDDPINIEGVHFEVPTGTRMLFGAPALNFEKGKGSTRQIFSVHGSLIFYADGTRAAPEGSKPENKHSIIRVKEGGTVETDAALHFTHSGLMVAQRPDAPDPIGRNSRWAQRLRHQKHATDAPSLVSMFAPPRTTRESFEERLEKSPMYLNGGDELHWPSSMSIEDGTVLTLGVDGSLLLDNQAAASAASVEAESDRVVQPLVTLVAADVPKANRALKKRLTRGGKAVDVGLPVRKDGLKVPGCAGSGAGDRTVLTVTLEGDVDVTIDGKRVLHKTNPNNDRTWRRKLFDRVKGRKRPKGNYEMRLVSDGFEVRLDGATIWGVHAADLPPMAS